jgi:hypothetical protein
LATVVPNLARQRPVGAAVFHQQPAVYPAARRVPGQLFQLLLGVERVQRHTGGVRPLDRRHLLHGVAEADAGRRGADVEAGLDLFDARGIEAAA